MEIFIDDDTKLTLHGLQQYYVKLEESQKNRKLTDLLDSLEFNQVCTLVLLPQDQLRFAHLITLMIFFVVSLRARFRSLFLSRDLLVLESSASFLLTAISLPSVSTVR
jgi:hypothetical protein